MRSLLLLAPALLALAPAQDEDTAPIAANDPDTFEVPDGLEWTLWAESPHLYNPTAMDIDHRGRVWVTETVNYRKWDGRNPGRDHPEGERVMILEDTDLDGKCDSSKVFVQDPELKSPLGICVLGDRVLVAASPHLFEYRDTDGDDVADERTTLLTGFGGWDHDHGLHSPTFGPDGKLYIAVGNAGPHIVTDKDGWTLRSGSLYNGGGPEIADNKPGLVSDDGRAYTGGLVLRMNPDGSGLEVLAHNFRNNYEVAVDGYGDMFQSDNDDDGNKGCRYVWVMEGGDYGYFSSDGTRYWRPDMRPGQSIQTAHWHQDDPGVVPSPLITGAGGPTGVAMYEAGLMADWFDGFMLGADAGAKTVYACEPKVVGAGIEMQNGFLIRSRKGHPDEHQFRPSDVAVAHDGSVFVADWFDPGVGGHRAQDQAAYGRILRVAPTGFEPERSAFDWESPEDQRAALRSPAPAVRFLGYERLTDGAPRSREVLLDMLGETVPARSRALALFALAGTSSQHAALGLNAMAAGGPIQDPRLAAVVPRVLSNDVLRDLDAGIPQTFGARANAVARREHAFFSRSQWEHVGRVPEMFENLDLERWDLADRFALEALGIACQGHEAEAYAAFHARYGGPALEWSARFEPIAWRLHPVEAVPDFLTRAMHEPLDVDLRRRSIDALAFIPDRSAAEAMSTVALGGPRDLRAYAAWWLRHRSTNDWRDFGIEDPSSGVTIEGAETVWTSELMKRGEVEVEADVSGASRLWLVVTDGGNGNSCDWADWLAPTVEVDGETLDLTQVAWVEARAGWGSVQLNRNASGGPLSVGGTTYERGIGTHAESRIAFDLPAGATTFRARAACDDGGTRQGATSVRFQVLVTREAVPSRIPRLTATMMDEAGALEARSAAARELAADGEGAHTVLALAERGRITADLEPALREVLFAHADPTVRSLARQYFASPDAEEAPGMTVEALMALTGDPHRGREVFQTERAQCTRCHGFTSGLATVGGDIGPDLTLIREKYGRRELFGEILDPSAAIAFGYDTFLMEDEDGVYHTGFLLADGEDVVLKDTQGERHVIPADTIVARHKMKDSVMPQGVTTDLTPQEVADIVAFLQHDPGGEAGIDAPRLGQPIALFDGTSLDAWTYHLTDEDASMDDVWSIEEGGVLRCKGNPIGYIRTTETYDNFVLELDWRFDPEKGAGNSGVLLRMVGEDKVWPKSMEAQLHSRNAGDIWNIETFPARVDAARTSGRRTQRMAPCNEKPLGEWNHYRIVMNRGHLRLYVNGDLQNWADWVEEVPGHVCLQSEGAEIHFRDVVLTPILD